MTTGNPTRSKRRTVVGTVVSDKMDKTIVVRVARKVRHPVYEKYVARHEVFKAHDEKEQAKEGDTVEIAFTRRPLPQRGSPRAARAGDSAPRGACSARGCTRRRSRTPAVWGRRG